MKNRKLKRRLLVSLCICIPFLIVALCSYCGYFNPYLTMLAMTGKPIIDQATQFYKQHGRAPTDRELRVLVHDPRLNAGGSRELSNGIISIKYPHTQQWWYVNFSPGERSDGIVFLLTKSLDHDSGLFYKFDGSTGVWSIHTDDIDGDWPVHLFVP